MNYYMSDLHIGHANAIKFDNRPFADVNEMNNEILSFCEENELTFKLIDIENVFSCDISQYSKEIQNKMQSNSFFMIEKEKETYSLEQFWDVLDEWRKRKNKEGKCRKCGKMVNPSSGIDICIDCCLSKNDSTLNIIILCVYIHFSRFFPL